MKHIVLKLKEIATALNVDNAVVEDVKSVNATLTNELRNSQKFILFFEPEFNYDSSSEKRYQVAVTGRFLICLRKQGAPSIEKIYTDTTYHTGLKTLAEDVLWKTCGKFTYKGSYFYNYEAPGLYGLMVDYNLDYFYDN